MLKLTVKGNYIGGEFRLPNEPTGEWVVKSPADFSDELGRVSYSYASVDDSVAAARVAFDGWRRKPLAERTDLLKRYQAALKRHEAELAEIIAREVGKPLWESKTEVAAMINKIDVTVNDSLKLVADYQIPQIMEGTTGSCRYRPLGVMAVVGPFNFPGHLANGHIVPALLTGNTVIFKPSEKAPLTGQIMAECFHEAGLPAGVFNLLQGEREVSRRLCVHDSVDAVLFTGSYEVGLRLKQDTLQQHWKLLALEMGGKNPSIVWSDADLELAVHDCLVSAYVTAGQRCSSTSRILVHESIADRFVQRFHDRAKAFTIGHPMDNPFMGPLIDQPSVDRYLKFLGIASREGCEIVMRGKALELPKQGCYVAPSICRVKDSSVDAARKSVYQQTEFFAPNVAITAVREPEEAIALANVTQYGLAASVFTREAALFEKFFDGINAGLINWNKATVGASSRLPFGGFKKSGNHFPAAVSATLYCAAPVASLESPQPKSPTDEGFKSPFQGLNWAK